VNTEIVEARVKEDLKAGYCARLKGIFRESIDLRWKYGNGMAPDFTEQVEKIVEKLTQELNRNDLSDPDDRRLCKELRQHHQRGNLLRFLNDLEIEPTNNLAERGLRPAVIARKVSQCSKNDAGADSYARVMSIVQSLHKRTPNLLLESLTEVFRTGTMPPAPSRAAV
jgi:hypothetical protein